MRQVLKGSPTPGRSTFTTSAPNSAMIWWKPSSGLSRRARSRTPVNPSISTYPAGSPAVRRCSSGSASEISPNDVSVARKTETTVIMAIPIM